MPGLNFLPRPERPVAARSTQRAAWPCHAVGALLFLTVTVAAASATSPVAAQKLPHAMVPAVQSLDGITTLHGHPAARTASPSQVAIAGFAFNPAKIVIHAGQVVTWTNRDAVTHTVTGQKGDWDSGNLATGASFSHTFTQPGTYDYVCAIHPNMTGQVVVQ